MEPDIERIQKCIDQLSEHFDSVQVFCTRHEMGTDDGTINCTQGQGNWFARYGQIRAWVVRMEESDREQMRERG